MQTAVGIVIAGLLVAGAILWVGRYEPLPTGGQGTLILDRLRGELRECALASPTKGRRASSVSGYAIRCDSLGPVASPPN